VAALIPGPVTAVPCCCWLAQADRVRARAANMDNRIVSLLAWIFQFSPDEDASLIQR